MFPTFSVEVIDPVNRTGKINVPLRLIEETRGVADFQHCPHTRDIKDLSLCLLFQQGRCKAGSRCHQVHADPSYVAMLRERAATGNTCCAAHGDVHSQSLSKSAQHVKVAAPGVESQFYPLSVFGRTAAMDAFLRNANGGLVLVSANKICRLHAQNRCKFGKDCKNVHLCPRAAPLDAPPLGGMSHPLAVPFDAPSFGGMSRPLGIAPVCATVSVADLSCGLSSRSHSNAPHSMASSVRDSPAESFLSLDHSVLHDLTPLKAWNEPSPMMDATDLELSLFCTTLCESVLSYDE